MKQFVKMEGLGNDFVVLEGPQHPSAQQVAAWCDRRRGVGADGVLVATSVDPSRVRMDYWNADGTTAEFCGNGLRCVARLAWDRGWTEGSSFVVETPAGDRPVAVGHDGEVRALLGSPELQEETEVAGVSVRPVRLGNPHAVVLVDDPVRTAVGELGHRIGGDRRFAQGANVEFVTVRSPRLLEVRVWERGVGETLACASGAGAAAAVAHRLGRAEATSTVLLPGGELHVEIDRQGVWASGPARYVFRGQWEEASA
ncbi:MAG: diaminopimelate epimerase [Actinomycetota bacterium]|nr:diaminopimelate epimerase [Actinomycetota bacterium]